MNLSILLRNVQHISEASIDVNLNDNKITCIVGKNGIGKTTIIKAICNLKYSDTFVKTSSSYIFNENSIISYGYGDAEIRFTYDSNIRTINSKDEIPSAIKNLIDVELPIPFGTRFNYFQSISSADKSIRQSIILNKYSKPEELIMFLGSIYLSDKFDCLVEISVGKDSFYCIPLSESKYIREDYFSSGEYFLISLYRKIKNGCKLIVIDEIDISLDASAQVKLVEQLRLFSKKYEVNILFTTHSLALIKSLNDGELIYMTEDSPIKLNYVSYSYVKSVLFGYVGWDKYIITEDDVLLDLINFFIARYNIKPFYKYKIVYVGGSGNVIDLMRRNAAEKFFSSKDNVISILDGDQKIYRHSTYDNVYCIPFESVEKDFAKAYKDGLIDKIDDISFEIKDKHIYEAFIRGKHMSQLDIFSFLVSINQVEVLKFSHILRNFLER